ncbi:nuclear protein localization protein 4 homolog [Galendromus occidentalis]|uniref:Nuclear protein localization protein 4 homolog n=1 Tax=Galendromus occidentalis TaxID=34638 RepID=A0AAJ7SGJ3_9ACAR|nr:nuclear protein localization protein 4 homolog [Galendromus occidentalis]
MLIRVQGPDGQKRIEVESGETTETLMAKIRIAYGYLDCEVFTARDHKTRVPVGGRSLAQCGLKNGDLLFVRPVCDEPMTQDVEQSNEKERIVNTVAAKPDVRRKVIVAEDEVDKILSAQDGRISRSRHALCNHNVSTKCVLCTPLEPYDEAYLKEKNIKHLSFHSYIKKLTSGVDQGKFAPLENISLKIKPNCSRHPPYPKGICSKCQPSAVTLDQQKYRHVDAVLFENSQIVNRFLDFWRQSLLQRVGILLGRYETYNEVPLGICARVAAIYEPPQNSARDGFELLDDPNEETVDELCAKLGLRRVGWIFCDLLPLDVQKGTVHYLRDVDFSYLLSAQECITAAALQNKYPNPCKLSSDGYSGSKFVTVCVTGDKNNQIHMEAYQVSNQCMALVKDDCLIPTQDAPELAWVKESTPKKFVPDVFYKTKDRYGLEVQKVARPLPVEFLLIDLPVFSPNDSVNTFRSEGPHFTVENRAFANQVQDLPAVNQYLRNFTASKDLLAACRDFHFLLYLATLDVVHLEMDKLLEAVKTKNAEACNTWAAESEQWRTFETILSSMGSNDVEMPQKEASRSTWNCEHCTFTNESDTNTCEMCSLPRT